MVDGLYAAATGMIAQQSQLDAIANNLANLQTPGYHSEQLAFTDLAYNRINEAGTTTTTGAGAKAVLLGWSAQAGALRETGNPLDLAIEGEGFFVVRGPNGERLLTRDGAFALDSQGRLVTAGGRYLEPPIALPPGTNAKELSISPEGVVRVGGRRIGQLTVVTVTAPEHLQAVGEGNFAPTAQSGAPRPATGARIRQGFLEGSDVEMAAELAQMALAQRSYQMDAAAVQTEGQMLSIANQLYTSA